MVNAKTRSRTWRDLFNLQPFFTADHLFPDLRDAAHEKDSFKTAKRCFGLIAFVIDYGYVLYAPPKADIGLIFSVFLYMILLLLIAAKEKNARKKPRRCAEMSFS